MGMAIPALMECSIIYNLESTFLPSTEMVHLKGDNTFRSEIVGTRGLDVKLNYISVQTCNDASWAILWSMEKCITINK